MFIRGKEHPTIVLCSPDPGPSDLDCGDLDRLYEYKKIQLTSGLAWKRIEGQLSGDASLWEGRYLVHMAAELCVELDPPLPSSCTAVLGVTPERLREHAWSWSDLPANATLELKCDVHSTHTSDVLELLKLVPPDFTVMLEIQPLATSSGVGLHLQRINGLMEDLLDANPRGLMLPADFFRRSVLLRHPCNAYACKNGFCHSGKSGNPRKVFVRPDRCVVPEDPRMLDAYIVHDLTASPPEIGLRGDAVDRFTKDMKWLFEEFVVGSEHAILRLHDLLPFVEDLRECLA